MNYDVIVVGGGAAGMTAACAAGEYGAKVLLLERNEMLGKKLRITGKGRCNLTNRCTIEEFFNAVTGEAWFLRSALSRFTPENTMEYFENLGLPLMTERGNRVFPVSERASDVVDVFEQEMKRRQVVRRRAKVAQIHQNDGQIIGITTDEGEKILTSCVVLATGGLSYPKTGSDGDGYRFARDLGHAVTDARPSLVPLCASDTDCARMQGLSLRNVVVSLTQGMGGKSLWSAGPGEMLFTHFGLSGPLILSASAYWKPGLHISIDLKPGLDEEQLDARLLRDFTQHAAKRFRNALGDLLPSLMIPVFVERSGIDPDKRTGELTRIQRRAVLSLLKSYPIAVSGSRSIAEAVITRGGVPGSEIHPKTMESRLVRGLYIAGELLDADALTGGYNLQIAWSTGRAAGLAAAEAARKLTDEYGGGN